MRKLLAVVVTVAALAPLGTSAASAETGHPIGECPVSGGWALDDYVSDNQSAILVDVVYGNDDGLLCVKLPSAHAPYPMIIDNVVPPPASG